MEQHVDESPLLSIGTELGKPRNVILKVTSPSVDVSTGIFKYTRYKRYSVK